MEFPDLFKRVVIGGYRAGVDPRRSVSARV
jgi:hypothetical protein